MKLKPIVDVMEHVIDRDVTDYLLYDFHDLETQERFLSEITDNDDPDWLEMLMEAPEVQQAFETIKSRMSEFRQMVLQSYVESQELPKQFRRDVL